MTAKISEGDTAAVGYKALRKDKVNKREKAVIHTRDTTSRSRCNHPDFNYNNNANFSESREACARQDRIVTRMMHRKWQ